MELKDIISSGLLELYAMGMTSPEETQQVEEWIAINPEVAKELDSIQEGIENYAIAHAVEPSPDLKKKILAEIEHVDSDSVNANPEKIANVVPLRDKQDVISFTLNTYFKWAAVACFILLIGSLILTYNYYDKYHHTNSELAATKNELQNQKQLALDMRKEINMVTDKNSLPVSLSGTPDAPDASAKILWMKNSGDVYIAPNGLPPAPSGKQYQLWAIVNGKPVDAGMITTEKGNYHFQKMKTFGNVEAFAVTLEKAGGSVNPTMPIYVHAKI